jgi:hypothetical protein
MHTQENEVAVAEEAHFDPLTLDQAWQRVHATVHAFNNIQP